MICPKCGAEYREGFTRCGDCNVDLIEPKTYKITEEELESGSFDPEDVEDELVVVLETAVPSLITEFEYKLERRQIPYLEQSGTLYGASTAGRRSLHQWYAKVWVPLVFEEQAKEVLNRIDLQKFLGPATGPPSEDSE
ncbi:MAG TPA: hypothetical protein VFG11_05340 [Acidobacteriota bacterium]|nr:hypothetical protein [Acidobacteriota bacterium]